MPHIVISQGMNLIGERNGDSLDRVRAIILMQNRDGQVMMAIKHLVGKPESINIPDSAIIYEVNDEQIEGAYFESITGLSLPSKSPVPFSQN